MFHKVDSSRCFKLVRINIWFITDSQVRSRKFASPCKVRGVVFFPFSMPGILTYLASTHKIISVGGFSAKYHYKKLWQKSFSIVIWQMYEIHQPPISDNIAYEISVQQINWSTSLFKFLITILKYWLCILCNNFQ